MSMEIPVHFYSYFKELAGCAVATLSVREGGTLDELVKLVLAKFPKLAAMERSMLVAVGVEYQERSYVLKQGDEVSMFPPVQGG